MAQHHYSVAGLHVAIDRPMPGLIARPPGGLPDIVVAEGDVPPLPDKSPDPVAEFVVEIAGVMRLVMRQGKTVHYARTPGAQDDDLALYLGGTALGALMHQRGEIVLHASAVAVGDGAVLFCGASGAGKSTLAAALVAAGYAHVADDFSVLRFGADGRALIAPDGRHHRLWQTALDGLAISGRRGAAVQGRLDKFFVEPSIRCAEMLPVSAIYELAEGDAPAITPAKPFEIVRMLQHHAYRPTLVALMRQQRLYFDATTRIAAMCGCYRFTRPLRFDCLDESIAQLARSWPAGG